MHALHLPLGHLWKLGLVALGLTLVLLALGALVAPAILEVSAPTVTTVETTAGEPAPPPVWKTDPLAPPPLIATR
jgi:hypothetical protein